MKIFIICCLLFVHVNMCIFIRGFRVSIRVSGIRGFGFGDGFPPESVSGSGSGFGFGCTETSPDPNPVRCHPYSLGRGGGGWMERGYLFFYRHVKTLNLARILASLLEML